MIHYQKTEIEKNQLDNFDLKLFFSWAGTCWKLHYLVSCLGNVSVQFRFKYMFNESCWQWQPAAAETEQSTDQVTTGGHVPQYWKQPSRWVACCDIFFFTDNRWSHFWHSSVEIPDGAILLFTQNCNLYLLFSVVITVHWNQSHWKLTDNNALCTEIIYL